jgi:radical SAM protein with 4Fe4S-binding SPASM domain
MKTIRLEAVNPAIQNSPDVINRILVFDDQSCELKLIDIAEQTMSLDLHVSELRQRAMSILENVFPLKDDDNLRIIHNPRVENAYSAPFKAFLDITLACQLSCSFCLSASSPCKANSLSREVSEQIIEEMGQVGVFLVKLGGGEPILHPDFWHIVEYLQGNGIFVSMSTNGIAIDEDCAKKIMEHNIKVSVSIDGMEEIHDLLRGEGVFKKAVSAVRILKNAGVPKLSIRMNIFPGNFHDVQNVYALSQSLGVQPKFGFCRPSGRAKINTEYLISPNSASDYFDVLKFLNRPDVFPNVAIDETMMFVQPESLKSILYGSKLCGAASRSIHINPFGEVTPCVFMGPDYVAGKIEPSVSLMTFWRGETGTAFERVRNFKEPNDCTNCDRLCKHECSALRMHFNNGNPSGPDPICLPRVIKRASESK